MSNLRSIVAIKEDMVACSRRLTELNKELDQVRKACPHPDAFLELVSHQDSEDTSAGGVGVYEGTYMQVRCNLCGHRVSHTYHRKHDRMPTLRFVIDLDNK